MSHPSPVPEIVAGTALLLLVAAAILALSKRLRLPFTVALVLVGMLLNALSHHYPGELHLVHSVSISPELILFVFLPTLIFESTYNLDARQLRRNLAPVMLLAAPGLLLSTALIGLILWAATPIPLAPALLLGAILSATDPVAVIALFKQLGAPQRLVTLVEGESLFNDATSIVVARILVGVVVAGGVSGATLVEGAIDFVVLFFGGLLVGWLMGLVTGWLLGLVESDAFMEITLTTVLAYASFWVAEHALHVSGVMATVAAGITLGGWGRTKVSPAVRVYLEHFWEYMAFIANALIFLLVGLQVEFQALWDSLDLLVWVIVAMLVARAALTYGLIPLLGRLPGHEPIDRRYQTVMYWGGLRGAIALAIALSLPAFEYADTFVALVMGAVLFTLLAQGLTMAPLMRKLGLDVPPAADRYNYIQRDLNAAQMALAHIPSLQRGGLFSATVARQLQGRCEQDLGQVRERLERFRHDELGPSQNRAIAWLDTFAEERALYGEMFTKGHLSESAYRELLANLTLQLDAVRYDNRLGHYSTPPARRRRIEALQQRLAQTPLIAPLVERMRLARVALDYEIAWGHYQASRAVLKTLDEAARSGTLEAEVHDELHTQYSLWHDNARRSLDSAAEQFPEFVTAMQERLGERNILLARAEATEHFVEQGRLSRDVGEGELAQIAHDLRALRGFEVATLRVEPTELLRKVPFFQAFAEAEFTAVAQQMKAHTIAENAEVIHQDEPGDSLYLIARGVVRVQRQEADGTQHQLATLMAGDFFGEMALLRGERRSATVRAVTPSSLYELKREALDRVMAAHPDVRRALEEVMAQRSAQENLSRSQEAG